MNADRLINTPSHSLNYVSENDRKVGYLILLLGLLGTLGGLINFGLLRSGFPGLPEIRMHNAITLILIGIGLISHIHWLRNTSLSQLFLSIVFVNGCIGILEPILPEFVRSILTSATSLAGIEDGSFILGTTGFSFLLLSFVILFTSQESYSLRITGQLINGVLISISLLTLLGFLFRDPGLQFLTNSKGMSLPSALAIGVLSVHLALHDPEIGLGYLFSRKTIGTSLARIVFPITVGSAVLLASIFLIATQNNWFRPETLMTLVVAVFIIASIGVTCYIVNITNRIDEHRNLTNHKLEELNASLENQIIERASELSLVTQRLDSATKGANISIWEWDVNSNIIKGNSVFFQLFDLGSDQDSISMNEVISRVHEDDMAELRNLLIRVYKHNESIDITHRIQSREGEIKYVRLKGFPVRNENDRVTQVYGAHWDVTAQEMVQQTLSNQSKALEVLNDRLTFATKGAKIGIWEMELSNQKVVWNDQMYALYDLSPEEFEGHHDSWASRVHPEDFAKLTNMQEVIAAGKDFEVIFRIYHKDGTLHAIKSNGFFQRENGVPVRMVGTNCDVTDQILAQTALEESYQLNNRFVDEAPSAIAMFDKNLNYLAASKRWKQDYGLESIDVQGRSHYELFPELSNERRQLHRKCLEGNILKNEEEAFVWRDGSTRWLNWEMRPWYTHENEVGGLVMFTADVTEKCEQQELLREAKENLEQLSIKLLKQNKLLADFAHITSHNLRAPVGNLNTLNNFYKEATTCTEKELIFSKFSTVVEHITATLQELVTALKIKEETDRELEEQRFEDVFRKVSMILSGQIMEHGVKLQSDFSQLPAIHYNKIYLESIFQNLLSNAIKYRSPDRSPEIKVWTSNRDGKPMLFVEDNGLGLDMDRHGHKLFGLHKTFHRNPDSYGLGLFLTKTQVEAMSGEIWAESQVDVGSTFIVKFSA